MVFQSNEKGPFAEMQSLNIFKDHHIVAYLDLTAVGCDR